MTENRPVVNIEVHTNQKGRWAVHGRYSANERETAIDDAKGLAGISTVSAVRVVREVFDPVAGTRKESVIYKDFKKSGSLIKENAGATAAKRTAGKSAPSQSARNKPASAPVMPAALEGAKPQGQEDAFPVSADSENPQPPLQKENKGVRVGLLGRIVLIILASTTISFVVTALGFNFLRDTTLFGIDMVGRNRVNSLFLIAVASFILAAVSLSFIYLSKLKMDTNKTERVPNRQPGVQVATFFSWLRSLSLPEFSSSNYREKAEPPDLQPEPEQEEEAEDDFQDLTRDLKEPARQQWAPDITRALTEYLNKQFSSLEDLNQISPLQKNNLFFLTFLRDSIDQLKLKSEADFNNLNKFGISLFLAGANEKLKVSRDLPMDISENILSNAVRVIGFVNAQADSFAANYGEYIYSNAGYMQMFKSGGNALDIYLEGENGGYESAYVEGAKQLNAALAEWNRPKKATEIGPVTVLFTDIVGSTDLTQNKGDSHIQKIVRIHNLIVRQALTKYQGKEIKHTGDGIMASFASTTDAVESAAFIQKCIVDNNMHNPDMTFYLKIGLNVGEPIYEDDDLLGTAVQLSSRVCDQADEGQILVTDAVQALCKGGRIRFVNRGPFALKGFKEAMTLYEVDWRNSSATEKEGLSSDEMLLQAEEAGEDMEELNAGEAADGNAPVASEAGQPEDEQAEENVEAVESLSKEFRGEAEDDDFPPAPEDAPAEISKDEIAGEPEQVPTEETKEDPTEGKSVSSHKILR